MVVHDKSVTCNTCNMLLLHLGSTVAIVSRRNLEPTLALQIVILALSLHETKQGRVNPSFLTSKRNLSVLLNNGGEQSIEPATTHKCK